MAGIFGQLGGNSAKRDRGETLNAYTGLRGVMNFGGPAGQQSFGAGQQSLGTAGNYYQNLLGGSRSALQQAVAPETSMVNAQADAQKRQLAESGTARGGGVAGVNQQAESNKMAAIDNLLFGVRPNAAAGSAGVGQAQAGAGLGALSIGTNAASDLARASIASRPESQGLHNQAVGGIVQGVGDIASLLMGGIPGAGGGLGGFFRRLTGFGSGSDPQTGAG